MPQESNFPRLASTSTETPPRVDAPEWLQQQLAQLKKSIRQRNKGQRGLSMAVASLDALLLQQIPLRKFDITAIESEQTTHRAEWLRVAHPALKLMYHSLKFPSPGRSFSHPLLVHIDEEASLVRFHAKGSDRQNEAARIELGE